MTLSELQKLLVSSFCVEPSVECEFRWHLWSPRECPRKAFRKFVLKLMKHPKFFWYTDVWFSHLTEIQLKGPLQAKEASSFFLFHIGIWVASLKPWNSAVDASIGSDQNNSMENSWKVRKISDSSPFTLWKFSVSMLNFEFRTFSFYTCQIWKNDDVLRCRHRSSFPELSSHHHYWWMHRRHAMSFSHWNSKTRFGTSCANFFDLVSPQTAAQHFALLLEEGPKAISRHDQAKECW